MLQPAAQIEPPRAVVPASAVPGFGTVLCLLGFVFLWCLGRPYSGIVGDAILYVGRGLADADPGGVGQDLMFVDDGQSQFSLFTVAMRLLVASFGPGHAALALAVGGQALWVMAIATLAVAIFPGRPRAAFAVLIAIAVVQSFYGPYQRFHAAEALAVPRPYAEAFVLLALTAMLRGRDLRAALFLGAATLLHPIMALAGFGVVLAIKASEDRRWLIAAATSAVAFGLAGWLGVPLVGRLFIPLDAAWRTVLIGRSPMLFPSRWDVADFAAIGVQAVTVGMAASLSQGRLRALLIGALLVGLAGLSASELLGDRLSLLLVVQTQPWRALWLVAVLAVVSFVRCGVGLATRQAGSQLAFVLLVLAWSFIDQPLVATVGAVAAGVVEAAGRRRSLPVAPATVRAAAFAVGALMLVADAKKVAASLQLLSAMPAGLDHAPIASWCVGLTAIPLTLLAIWWAGKDSYHLNRIAALALAMLLAAAAGRVWDDRSLLQKRLETDGAPAGLSGIVAAHAGPVLWMEGIEETTLWLRRPNWYSTLQGTGAVFSRPLALEWDRRKSELIGLRLLPAADTGLPANVASRPLPQVTATQIDELCRHVTTLAWVVLPVLEGASLPADLIATNWRPPGPVFRMSIAGPLPRWTRIDHYALAACADNSRQPEEAAAARP